MSINESAKAAYLSDSQWESGRAPVEDPVVASWLAGTFAVGGDLACHLAKLTHGQAEWWKGRDEYFLARGGVIRPAEAIYEVRLLEQWEDSYTMAIFRNLDDARACVEEYENDPEREETGRFATLWRRALWLPLPGTEEE